ncbi:hypothetical protein CR513_08163, partial [Mucuna pruriens]
MENFGAQYTMSKTHHLTSIALVNLRWEEDESLRSFMKHFLTVAVKIRDLNPERLPTSKDKLRAWAFNYIQMEEMAEYQDGAKIEHQATTNRRREGRNLYQLTKKKGSQRDAQRPKYQVFTLLTTSRVALVKEAFNTKLMHSPPKEVVTRSQQNQILLVPQELRPHNRSV